MSEQVVNSMPAAWCAARVAEIRAHLDQPGMLRPAQEYRTNVIELLAQFDAQAAALSTATARATDLDAVVGSLVDSLDNATARAEAAERDHTITCDILSDARKYHEELAARAEALEAEVAGLRQEAEWATANKLAVLREQNQPYYVPGDCQLPAAGVSVLLQPNHEWAAPEIGRLAYDEEGAYWQVNGYRSTRFALENYKGWVYLPKILAEASAAAGGAPIAGGAGEGGS